MKIYTLKRDALVFTKGATFKLDNTGNNLIAVDNDRVRINLNQVKDPDYWFDTVEQVKMGARYEPKADETYFYADAAGGVHEATFKSEADDIRRARLGNAFQQRQEAEEHVVWLAARAALMRSSLYTPQQGEPAFVVDYNEGLVAHQLEAGRSTKAYPAVFASEDEALRSSREMSKNWLTYYKEQ